MTLNNRQGINIVVSYIVMWIVTLVAQAVMVIVTLNESGALNLTDSEEIRILSISNIVLYLSLTTLLTYMLHKYLKQQLIFTKNNFLQFIKIVIFGLLGLFAAVMLATILMDILGVTEGSENQETLNRLIDAALFDRVALIIFSVLFAPFVEEIVFRGAIYGFVEKKSAPLAVIVSGLSFGLIHVLSGDFVQIIIYGGLGLVLAYIYYLSKKNIITVITIHMLYNLVVTILLFNT